MIPAFMDNLTPPGERYVFNLLTAGPDNWVALHSLDLAPWNHGLRCEIDFLLIVPDAGILCIEVKSHDKITFDGHRWHPASIAKSPFKQALDGRHTFYRRLKQIAPQFRRFPVVHCCIFPRASFQLPPNLSIQQWELMDARIFKKLDSAEFCADLRNRIKQSIEADINLAHPDFRLSEDQVEIIIKCCVPVQKFRPDFREEIVCREKEIEALLREQQKTVLQLSQLNPRLIVSGGAGTGKTLIAMEVARRMAEVGYRVALLCFNQLIGEWMKKKIEQDKRSLPNLVTGRAISIMAKMSGVQIPKHPSRVYWESNLPAEIEERITDPVFKASASFDYLVLDEAQDFMARPKLWQCLTNFINGGIDNGSFAIFGDFEHQILSAKNHIHQTLKSLICSGRPVRWKLSENCRNYRIVGETAVQLAGMDESVYEGYLRSGGTVKDYDIYFYRHEKEQLERIAQYLREFKAKGYNSSEITILSFRADNSSAAASLEQEGYNLHPAWRTRNLTNYASVHAFKGLENKIIILTDIVLDEKEFRQDLFYTGMTRATESVRVLCAESSKETILKWLVKDDH